ncbi:thioredoxin family protein [Sediminibacterium sp.]|uniref:thioredoxin family protein n=1 Tax=Sediminibacterium sp. TaxID=1917865 RepID=UPI0025D7D863|nr:thioredoxin family protein [Sediminibacterium sp.]MBT9484477.1 thioredoxin family protein [Sediminibacterium sp.]
MKQKKGLIWLSALILVSSVTISSCGNASSGEAFVNSKEGIQFSASSLQQLKEQSKKESKPIFLLAHASYCAACKEMINTVFTDKETGDLFNKHFINTQIDIESEEGKKIVKDYGIEGTPTLLFLSPNGKMLKKESGFHNKEELITLTRGL